MEFLEIENVDEMRQIIESIPIFHIKAPSFIMMIVSFKGFILYVANIVFVFILIPASWFVVKNSRVQPTMQQISPNAATTQQGIFPNVSPNYNMMEHRNPQLPPQYQEFNQLPFNPQLIIAQKELMIATEQST